MALILPYYKEQSQAGSMGDSVFVPRNSQSRKLSFRPVTTAEVQMSYQQLSQKISEPL